MTCSLLTQIECTESALNDHPDWLKTLLAEQRWTTPEGHHLPLTIEGEFCTPVSKIFILSSGEPEKVSFFFKTSRRDVEQGRILDGQREVVFYNQIAKDSFTPALPAVHNVYFDSKNSAYFMLLQHLGDTHYQHEFALPPNRMNAERMTRTLAACHAKWWNHEQLTGDFYAQLQVSGNWQFSNPDSCLKILQDTENIYPEFEAFMGDRLPEHRQNIYKTLFSNKKRLATLLSSSPHRTIIHGDAHTWNFLLPKEDVDEPVKLIDWQNWDISAGPRDLAYMMTLFWFQDQRKTMQDFVFDVYLDELEKQGVSSYSREQAWTDYRTWAALNVIYPVWSHHYKMWPDLWYPQLERTLSAFEDLDCRQLLAENG